jgi:hypothetical protein
MQNATAVSTNNTQHTCQVPPPQGLVPRAIWRTCVCCGCLGHHPQCLTHRHVDAATRQALTATAAWYTDCILQQLQPACLCRLHQNVHSTPSIVYTLASPVKPSDQHGGRGLHLLLEHTPLHHGMFANTCIQSKFGSPCTPMSLQGSPGPTTHLSCPSSKEHLSNLISSTHILNSQLPSSWPYDA